MDAEAALAEGQEDESCGPGDQALISKNPQVISMCEGLARRTASNDLPYDLEGQAMREISPEDS